ncbi:MAG: Cys-Gln thioester bond-forming surface protein, partial [Oscillospiraceae bacterium]|nr:Cys-Gln thioester bond-forming surface protein [Oscillospiraceae bacterium]
MAAYTKRFLAMLIAVSLCLGAAPSAFAATVTETDTATEGGITSTVTTTTETIIGEDSTSVNITIKTQKDGVNSEGEEVDYDEIRKNNTEYTDSNGGTIVEKEWSVNGKEIVTSTKAPDVTADVPLTEEDDPETEETENKNTVTDGGETGSYEDTDNIPEDEKTGNNSDTTRTTVEQQGKVTIETTDVVITESQTSDTELDHVSSETKVIQGGENDNSLLYWDFRNGYKALSGLLEAIENDRIAMENGDENANTAGITPSEGYAYVYIGSDITSQYLPTYLYTTPSPDFPDEEPYMINGVPYYMRKDHPKNPTSTTFDHIFQRNEETGEMERIEVDENSQATTTFSVPQQFLLYDPVKKEVITTYCADVETLNESLFSYNMENLEDATYYSDAEAAMIRAVCLNGYWGTSSGTGSLESLKEALAANGFTEEELALLNDGMALVATQMAIWEYSNKSSDLEFLNCQYSKEPGEDGSLYTYWAGSLLDGSAPSEARESEMEMLFKVYNWLIGLDPVMANNDPNNPDKTLADTLVNAKNFIENMSITVIDKAEDHENNKDEDKTNDAYVTDITFALVVKPSEAKEGEEAPEDDLVVQIIGKNGGKEEVIATGRIVGEPQEGEIVLVPD